MKSSESMDSLFDISNASVSTRSLISVTLHSLGLGEMSAASRNQGHGRAYNSRARRRRKEAANVAVAWV
jgi:hypothetical protein